MNTFEAEASEYRAIRLAYWNKVNTDRSQTWSNYYREHVNLAYSHLVKANTTVLELGCGNGDLLASLNPAIGVGVDFSAAAVSLAKKRHPHLEFIESDALGVELGDRRFDFIIISELVNDAWDVQAILEHIKKYCSPRTRLIFNFYSHLWNIPLAAAEKIKIGSPQTTWVTC